MLVAQTRRMLKDAKARRLATEFACQWLHIRDFDQLDEKSERHFPDVRRPARRRCTKSRFGSSPTCSRTTARCSSILDADHTFLNEELAKHYGIAGVTGSRVAARRRREATRAAAASSRQATTLAKQSGASRTSPILRGNWVSEVLLGEKLPRPPKDVPQLPDDEAATDGLTVRQLVEKHTQRRQVRRLPRPDRSVRLRAGRLRRHRPPARQGPRRPADRYARRRCRTAPSSTASTACGTIC